MCLAIPGRIENILNDDPLARTASVSFGGIRKTVNLSFVPEAEVGDYVIVHVGIAISRLNESAATSLLDSLIDTSHSAGQVAAPDADSSQ